MADGSRRGRVGGCSRVFGVLLLVAACTGGCAGRFTTRTEYVAEGFSLASLRGRTVAVLPDAAAEPSGQGPTGRPALVGVAKGMRHAGARARVVTPPPDGAADVATTRPILAAAFTAPADPTAATYLRADEDGGSPVAWTMDVGTAYVLVVRVERDEPYRAYAIRPGGFGQRPAAARTSGRRLRLRLALLRASDGAAVWLATGSGNLWNVRTAPTADRVLAGSLGEDLNRGNLPLYPPPPTPQALTARLTRRLLGHVPPPPTEVQPN
jgi:hypothetical protein